MPSTRLSPGEGGCVGQGLTTEIAKEILYETLSYSYVKGKPSNFKVDFSLSPNYFHGLFFEKPKVKS